MMLLSKKADLLSNMGRELWAVDLPHEIERNFVSSSFLGLIPALVQAVASRSHLAGVSLNTMEPGDRLSTGLATGPVGSVRPHDPAPVAQVASMTGGAI